MIFKEEVFPEGCVCCKSSAHCYVYHWYHDGKIACSKFCFDRHREIKKNSIPPQKNIVPKK